MARPRRSLPKPPTDFRGQARTWWGDDYVYLGPFGSAQANRNYVELVRAASEGRPFAAGKSGASVSDVCGWHLAAVLTTLNKKDQSVRQMTCERVLAQFGDVGLSEFGPKAVRAWLEALARGDAAAGYKPLGIRTVRRYLNNLKAVLRWAITEEVVRADQFPWAEILEVKARGIKAAPPKKVLPVDPETVALTIPHLWPPTRALVELQMLTGMRPNNELFHIRPRNVFRSGRVTLSTGLAVDLDKLNAGQGATVWVYVPEWHKQQYDGAGRDVPLGPKAQAVLAPFLLRGPDEFCFSPRETNAAMHEAHRRQEKQKGESAIDIPSDYRHLRAYYSASSYRQAIEYACAKAGVPAWFPYQLRHTAATETTAAAGLDVARALLGQSDPRTTARYAERDFRAAAERMRQAG